MVDYPNFTVIVDTREQQPWSFQHNATASRKLDTGDYSIEGLENILCIERKKSVSEIANNITEKRFKDVLTRMMDYKYAFILFEFNVDDILRFPIGSTVPRKMWDKIKISAGFIMKNIIEMQVYFGVRTIFCGSAENAEKIAISLMRKVYEVEGKNNTIF
jgi:ERCC4-type nuclease